MTKISGKHLKSKHDRIVYEICNYNSFASLLLFLRNIRVLRALPVISQQFYELHGRISDIYGQFPDTALQITIKHLLQEF